MELKGDWGSSGQNSKKKALGSKKPLDRLKIDLNAV